MNYPQSLEILEKVKNSKKVLLSCHVTPDIDSVACNIALFRILQRLKVNVTLVSPDKLPDDVMFLPNINNIKFIDPKSFNYDEFDTFLILDINAWDRVTGTFDVPVSTNYKINFDHHADNKMSSDIKILDIETCSTAEIIYKLFQDWGMELDKDDATILLTGIYGDTEVFRYDSTKPQSLRISANLMELGAEKEKIIFNLYRSRTFETLKFWGEMLKNTNIDEEHKFIWTTMKHEDYQKYGNLKKPSSTFSSLFSRIVKGTNFGITMHEGSPGNMSISFRERNGIDVSGMAHEIGGGGHKSAAGGYLENVKFEEAVEKVLNAARKYSKQKYIPKAEDL